MLKSLTFILIFLSILPYAKGQGQISTWAFAERIGMRGIQFQFGFLSPLDKSSTMNDLIIQSTPKEHKNQSIAELHNPDTWETPLNSAAQVRLTAVFLPFRDNKHSILKKSEWQSGFEFLASNDYLYSLNSTDDFVSRYGVNNYSLYWYNSLFIEKKLIFNNLKIYGGPGMGISLLPNYFITRKDSIESRVINSGKFGMTMSAAAGLKISLGCRVNLYCEYQVYNQLWFMDKINLNRWAHGLSFGLRYKFNKPEPKDYKDSENPVFW